MQSNTLRQPYAFTLLLLIAALVFASVQPVRAAEPLFNELIDANQTQATLAQVSKGSYSFKVTGVLLKANAKKVTVSLANKSYTATIKSNKTEFTLQKRVTLSEPLPTTVQITAIDNADVTHTAVKEIPQLLVDSSSLDSKKEEFIGDDIYYYEISGKLLTDVQSISVIAGATTKNVTVSGRSFKIAFFEKDLKSFRLIAQTADGKKQELEVKP